MAAWKSAARLLAFTVLVAAVLPGAGPVTAQDAAEAAGSVIVRYAGIPGLAAAPPAASLEGQGYRRIPVPPGMDAEEFAGALSHAPGVASAEPDAPVYAAAVPNDPFYQSSQAAYLSSIRAEQGWGLATGQNSIVVAVIDSGLDVTHPEFQGRLWENPLDADSDGVDDDGNGCIDDRYGCRFISNITAERADQCGYDSGVAAGAVLDDNGAAGTSAHSHGTLVSGILGAAGSNGPGIAGVAWNTRIMTVKVLDCGTTANGGSPSGEMSDVALGIDYARRMGADIINLSLAARPDDSSADLEILRAAIQAANDEGIIIVAAAGNAGRLGVGLPAAYTQFPNIIAVGAADNTRGNVWASYSGYGDAIDFAAPGNGIAGTLRTDLGISNPYGTETGTSFAAPMVTGMFVLMMSRNSVLGMQDYIQAARAAAAPAPRADHGGNWAGSGIIDIGKAVARVPMTVNGDALHDWMFVEPGVRIRAFIGANECGSTVTEAFGPVTRYAMRVLSDVEKAGCGVPGATVRFLIGADEAQPTLTWGGQDVNLGLINRDISTVSPPPGSIVVQELGPGWSIAAHLGQDAGTLPAGVGYLPSSWTQIHALDSSVNGGRYQSYAKGLPVYAQSLETLEQLDVFWVDGPQATISTPNPGPQPGRIIFLQPGWNAFLYTGETREVSDALAPIEGLYDQVLRYDNEAGAWLSHVPGNARYFNDFGALLTLEIYWIHMNASGFVELD